VQITLSPETDKFVQDMLDSGRYACAEAAIDAMVQAEIRRDRERARIEALLIEGQNSPAEELTDSVWEEIAARALSHVDERKAS
jgi:putative addiction module CopG family antidote